MTVIERRFPGSRFDYEVKYTLESSRFDALAPALRKSLDSFRELPGPAPGGTGKAARCCLAHVLDVPDGKEHKNWSALVTGGKSPRCSAWTSMIRWFLLPFLLFKPTAETIGAGGVAFEHGL